MDEAFKFIEAELQGVDGVSAYRASTYKMIVRAHAVIEAQKNLQAA